MKSIELSERIDELDYLRGFALLGIILVNITHMLGIKPPESKTLDAFYWKFLYGFVEGRFYTIFTFLFGVGFYIFMTRAAQRNPKVCFLRRMCVLLFFGLIHMQFQQGEALTIYAVCGLIILPFYQANKFVNLFFGAVLLFILSLFSIKIFMTVPLMLLGIAAGQFRVFERIGHLRKKLLIFTFVILIGSILALILQYHYLQVEGQEFLRVGIAVGPIVSACYVGIMLCSLQIPLFRKLFFSLKNYGRMALTNYVGQTALILAGSHLFGRITYIQSRFVCCIIYFIQLVFSTVWLRYFRFGPLEWIWRIVTYYEILPLRR